MAGMESDLHRKHQVETLFPSGTVPRSRRRIWPGRAQQVASKPTPLIRSFREAQDALGSFPPEPCVLRGSMSRVEHVPGG